MLAGWLALDLFRAKSALTTARTGFSQVQDRLSEGDLEGAKNRLAPSSASADKAARIVGGPPFAVFSRMPLVSASVREVQQLARAVDVVGNDVLPPLLASGIRTPSWQGRIDAEPFLAAQAPLGAADLRLEAVRADLEATPSSGIGRVTRSRGDLQSALDRLGGTVKEARVAADVVPALTGAEGRRRYFVALQNNAESRGTGGLIGAFAILRFDQGRILLEQVGENERLVDRQLPVLDLPDDYDSRYGRFQSTRTWRSANLSPDVPTAGRLLSALWRDQTGEQVDGVLLMDPLALADLLGATGPVTLSDGSAIDQGNAARLLMSDVYERYPDAARQERYKFLAETAQRTFTALSTRSLDGRTVVRQFVRAATSGHLQLWAADERLQARLLASRVSGALPTSGPFLSVVSNDAGGSKLDYYIRRRVRYEARSTGVAVDLGVGPQLEEEARLTVQLENRAPTGLPAYVVARPDDPGAPAGQAHTWLSVYLGPRATLLSATLDGKPVQLESGTERGLSVYSLFVKTDRAKTSELVLRLRQPAEPDQPLVYRQQPLVRDDELTVRRAGSPTPVLRLYRAS